MRMRMSKKDEDSMRIRKKDEDFMRMRIVLKTILNSIHEFFLFSTDKYYFIYMFKKSSWMRMKKKVRIL